MRPRQRLSPAGRRGVVLVLILGMLGLLALIGVTFASISGQARIGATNFAAGVAFPDYQEAVDFGLEQLINDTNNPVSAIRGHSLKRDMFGNDSTAYSVRANYSYESGIQTSTNQEIGNYLAQLPYLGVQVLNYAPLQFTGAQYYAGLNPSLQQRFQPIPDPGMTSDSFTYQYVQYRTNIPIGTQANGATYGLQFGRAPWTSSTQPSPPLTGWTLRLSAVAPDRTQANTTAAYYGAIAQTFEVLEDDGSGTLAFSQDPTTGLNMHVLTLSMPDNVPVEKFSGNDPNPSVPPGTTTRSGSISGVQVPLVNPPAAGLSFTNSSGIQLLYSNGPFVLDGRSQNAFNGPGLTGYAVYGNFLFNGVGGNNGVLGNLGDPNYYGMDEDYDAVDLENWFLGLQSADGHVVIPSFHRPGILRKQYDATSGLVTFDDWVNQTTGTGALTANDSRSRILRRRQIDMGAGFPDDPRPDPNTGQITYDVDNDGDGRTDAVWLDLGYPVQRDPVTGKSFKPMFAFTVLGLNGRLPLNTAGNLQGRFLPNGQNTYGTNQGTFTPPNPLSTVVQDDTPLIAGTGGSNFFGPFDAGSPTFLHTSHLGTSPGEVNPTYAFSTLNAVQRGAFNYGYSVSFTPAYSGGAELQRLLTGARDPLTGSPVAGRWGEPELIPAAANASYGVGNLNTLVRAGRSFPIVDGRDSDYDALDFYPPYVPNGTNPESDQSGASPPVADYLDTFALGFMLPSERARHFVTPGDPIGTGRVYPFNFNGQINTTTPSGPLTAKPNYPDTPADFGQGPDKYGRAQYFMYYRPPGMPSIPNQATPNIPDGYNALAATYPNTPNDPSKATNLYHGFEAFRNPAGIMTQQTSGMVSSTITATPAAPFRWDTMPYWAGAMPWNYNYPPGTAQPPTAQPAQYFPATVPTMDGNVNSTDVRTWTGQDTQAPEAQFPVPLDPRYNTTATGAYAAAPYVNNPSGYGLYPGWNFGANNPYGTTLPGVSTSNYSVGGGTLSQGEADQLNLYTPRSYDAPFGPHDLEWLYRVNDVDGPSLSSRLPALVPNFFGPNNFNQSGSITNNRLFSIDAWDQTTFAWAPDNPGVSAAFPNGVFPNNSRFGPVFNPNQYVATDSASFSKVDSLGIPPLSYPYYGTYDQTTMTYTYPASPYASGTNVAGQGGIYATPSMAHRGRRINLNFPFPIGGGSTEPVRQKWIRETYQTLKAIVPPKSIDTPEELAALSQFVVNIVDFRDPDSTITMFVNTDIMIQTPATSTSAATYTFNTSNGWALPDGSGNPAANVNYISPPYAPSTTIPNAVAPYDPTATMTNPTVPGSYLVQYGMEYPPIAITEILAFEYNKGATTSSAQQRIFIELLNTLTADANVPNGAASAHPAIEDLDLSGWQLWIAKDDPTGRPDPITGQPNGPLLSTTPLVLTGQAADTMAMLPAVTAGTPPAVPALRINGPDPGSGYYVLSNPPPPAGNDNNPPSNVEFPNLIKADSTSGQFFPPLDTTGAPIASGTFLWLYLTRPADPRPTFDTTKTPPRASYSSNQVVVDAFRFAYLSGDTLNTGNTPPITPTKEIYSLQRIQPYRGGHAVPKPASGVAITVPGAYGYSEQTYAPSVASNYTGTYSGTQTTKKIYQGLGAGMSGAENWDYLPFFDRDFSSVAELMLVPGCPPGLFTKQFVEVTSPTLTASVATPPTAKGTTFPFATVPNATVPTFPYLPDEFYYTADGLSTADNPPTATPTVPTGYPASAPAQPQPVVGWTTNAGWFKMFEMFEVPTSAAGAIGPIPAGQNFDWYRQDRRPGQINLNLIIDEEVFFGLIDDPRVNASMTDTVVSQYPVIGTDANSNNYPFVVGSNGGAVTIGTPVIVTQIDLNGTPTFQSSGSMNHKEWGCYPMTSRGYSLYDPSQPISTTAPQNPTTLMKAAFSDFLKLRHGGSGFLFGFGTGDPGTPSPLAQPTTDTNTLPSNLAIATERPYRSLSYPDIAFTLMRPANLPPSWYTATDDNGAPQLAPNPNLNSNYYATNSNTPAYLRYYTIPMTQTTMPTMQPAPSPKPSAPNDKIFLDPGLRNPYLVDPTVYPPKPPQIPPRRLIQVPDQPTPTSNASENGDASVNTPTPNLATAPTSLSNPKADLITNSRYTYVQLGSNNPGTGTDLRQHPYFRNELISKMMNLTTVRTHQYAVWVTVGFFEVIQPGNPSLLTANPASAADVIGGEVGLASGQNVRYRAFAVIDRSLATGFNAIQPGDFRDVITYRRRIE